MQYRTRKTAFIAMMLSDHASRVFPNANQILHPDGTLTVKSMHIKLQDSGKVRILNRARFQEKFVKLSQPEVSIPSNASQFESAGDKWGEPNFEFDAQSATTKVQPDGTRISVDHLTIEGYDDHGPIARPDFKPDPEPDPARIGRSIARRRKCAQIVSNRRRHGL